MFAEEIMVKIMSSLLYTEILQLLSLALSFLCLFDYPLGW